ncbi:porin [Sulfurimonas sp. C5]|uniref:outer membrane beta-barrel protein n=1 Tax=Sulfurimonas sp. C5 TaxID=3036947 RepID=UPI0024551B10|nr:porin [Sulfurimonas sp. C5]MDH4943771.1 hypothetical protein [Sulfurimonas sp. C5]
MKYIVLILFPLLLLQAVDNTDYKIGNGYSFDKMLTVGGYFSTEYAQGEYERSFKVDDVAVMAYGELTPQLNYMVEFEAVSFYTYDFKAHNDKSNTPFHAERVYLDYRFSDNFGIRAGKQITPIGYWNFQPINVLRDTTSNPLYSRYLFPKFLTGIALSGFLGSSYDTTYHVFAQETEDLDKSYINISTDHFVGATLEHELTMDSSIGGGIGQFTTLQNETYNFVQINAKYTGEPVEVSAEYMLRKSTSKNLQNDKSMGGYVQVLYPFSEQHALVSRYEYFDDNDLIGKDQIFLFGYSYRPIYPVSLKAEYQWHEQSSQNKLLASFSVLF